MKFIPIYLSFLFICNFAFSQNTANFTLRDDTKRTMCYTEYPNGMAVKNTTVEFKNTSTCTGNCFYVFDYGDNTNQAIKSDISNTSHDYSTDGSFDVRLQVVNKASIHDSIKNRPLTSVTYLETSDDSITIDIRYTGTDNSQKQAIVRIPEVEYNKKTLPYPITVYSPVVSGTNYTYMIDDPSTDDHKAPIQSFAHIFNVDTANFKPHTPELWTYYWDVYATNEIGEPKSTPIASFKTDSLEYKYTFPVENFNPGYYMQLTIALDSSKFEDAQTISYYNLEQCFASQHQIIPVTDYFFTNQTQKDANPLSRDALIPNTFTPGGNDENEVFFFNTNGKDIFTIWIYNSWGAIVYKEEALTITWTGKDNSGDNCPSGVYYYVIKSNNNDKRHETSGFIQLFRQN